MRYINIETRLRVSDVLDKLASQIFYNIKFKLSQNLTKVGTRTNLLLFFLDMERGNVYMPTFHAFLYSFFIPVVLM